ncbi:acetylserotonin O-methyltransferase-like [Salmo salar]|uniref:Acetylserotonin O-methyltransferase-like n=1 Tax=Salmo salar TaxID=8030 RepID=A0A1S3NZ04_SALSA|nr:acetylserotonin O-methyltransferase-like [Salmo salar]
MEVFLVSKTLFTVCEMGLFDLLASSWCPLSLEEVVQVIRASLSGTEKMYLTRSIHYSSKTIYLCWHYLIDAVREGSNQYEKAFGVKSDDLFEAMYRCEEVRVQFMQLMNSIWNICGRDVVTVFDLSPFRTIYSILDWQPSWKGAKVKKLANINGNQRFSTTDNGNQRFSTTDNGNQRFSSTDNGNQRFSTTNNGYQRFSTTDSGNQRFGSTDSSN